MNSEIISIGELLGCQALYRSRSLFSIQLLPAHTNSVTYSSPTHCNTVKTVSATLMKDDIGVNSHCTEAATNPQEDVKRGGGWSGFKKNNYPPPKKKKKIGLPPNFSDRNFF